MIKKRSMLTTLSLLLCLLGCNDNVKDIIVAKSDYQATEIDSLWQFRQIGSDVWHKAIVPGVVHTDLLRNNLIQSPYFSTNENKLQWIEKEQWEYKTVFDVSTQQMEATEIFLDFKGLDTYADVFLNEEKILSADNMFIEWKVPVKKYLQAQNNSLRILFRPSTEEGLKRAARYPKLPADNDRGEGGQSAVFTRKAQYHYGWDWGPRFVTVGIWKPVCLVSYNNAVIDNIHFVQRSQDSTKALFDARIAIVAAKESENAQIVIADEDGNPYATVKTALKKGEQTITLPLTIDNPQLWWPNGMGKGKPKLYTINTVVTVDGQKSDHHTQRIGVRTVRLVRQADEHGESFFFQVNGVPLFMKGANIIPQDVFLTEVTKERYEKMVDIAVEANMNMLRVWGGGIYESDDFYNRCDEQGILVWQDFPFACAFYPWDDAFYNSVRTEARQNIRRLRNHPSLAIWCGNNEIDEAWHHWGYTKDQKNYPWSDEDKRLIRKGIDDLFFTDVLPGVLQKEDTTRSYHPSSPLYGWGNPKSQVAGDVHYWGVYHGEEPFSVYKEKPGRFSNEYGHQSFANYDTWKQWLDPQEMKLNSDAMKLHQKNAKGYRVINDYMKREVPISDDFRTYVYLSQLVQADGIKIAMEGHRQNRPFTMGTLYWQLNDCWPVTSWSSLDYPFGYKALQYFAKKSFAPTILSFDLENKTKRIELWGITDEQTPKKGSYKLSVMDFNGNVVNSKQMSFVIEGNSSIKLLDESIDTLLKGSDARSVVLVAQGTTEDSIDLRSLLYLLPYKDLTLPAADYKVESIKRDNRTVEVTIEAKKLLKAVLFESDVIQENPSDAYFDLLPGEKTTVTLRFKDPFDKLPTIKVRTLNDMFH